MDSAVEDNTAREVTSARQFVSDLVKISIDTFKHDPLGFFLLWFVGAIVSVCSLAILVGPVAVGVTRTIRDARRGQPVPLSGVFSGMSSFGSGFMALTVPVLALSIFPSLVTVRGPIAILLFACCWAATLLICHFAICEIAYRNAGFVAAVRASVALIRAHAAKVALLFVVIALNNALGAMTCLGALITTPMSLVILVVGYELMTEGTATASVPWTPSATQAASPPAASDVRTSGMMSVGYGALLGAALLPGIGLIRAIPLGALAMFIVRIVPWPEAARDWIGRYRSLLAVAGFALGIFVWPVETDDPVQRGFLCALPVFALASVIGNPTGEGRFTNVGALIGLLLGGAYGGVARAVLGAVIGGGIGLVMRSASGRTTGMIVGVALAATLMAPSCASFGIDLTMVEKSGFSHWQDSIDDAFNDPGDMGGGFSLYSPLHWQDTKEFSWLGFIAAWTMGIPLGAAVGLVVGELVKAARGRSDASGSQQGNAGNNRG